ncbi:unnamed protein product [Chrysodeixis includens]|uniref:Uncharacterized protein n=1 Tax=Chrysodeixis includens TaxID=689277 RepID=A0A9N8L1N1_CHRIL|nr:unnamed protein product [Chrysodeixis includens]
MRFYPYTGLSQFHKNRLIGFDCNTFQNSATIMPTGPTAHFRRLNLSRNTRIRKPCKYSLQTPDLSYFKLYVVNIVIIHMVDFCFGISIYKLNNIINFSVYFVT